MADTWSKDPDDWPFTPPLDVFVEWMVQTGSWWRASCGHHLNVFEEAVDRIDELEAALRWLKNAAEMDVDQAGIDYADGEYRYRFDETKDQEVARTLWRVWGVAS